MIVRARRASSSSASDAKNRVPVFSTVELATANTGGSRSRFCSRSKDVRQPVFPPDRTRGRRRRIDRDMAAQLPRCVTDPLGTVSSLFDAAVASPAAGVEDGDWGVRAAFREGLAQLSSRALVERIPEINAVGVEHVSPGALVRFRCMVQDMYNPEYYVGAYRDAGGRWRTTKYSEDLGPADGPGQPADRKIWERRVLYCVPVPGESAWVRRLDGAGFGVPPSTPAKISEDRAPKKDKRARDEDVEMDAGDDGADEAAGQVAAALAGAGAAEGAASSRAAKAFRNDETGRENHREGGAAVHVHPGGDASPEDALNLPLGTEKPPPGFLAATPCIVKMYDDEDDVKLNDVLELVGVLGIAPALAEQMQDMSEETFGVFANQAAGQASAQPPNANANANLDFEFMDEERAHNPPTSIVPRFHVLAARRASPQSFAVAAERSVENSELAESTDDAPDGSAERWGLRPADGAHRGPPIVPRLARRGAAVREKLLAFLAAPLGGDALAAEFVLFSLLARVHTRSDGMPIGKFGVTLLGAPESVGRSGSVASALAETLAILAPATAHLPLSIASLNARAWAPRKDYATNRLRSGPLQLASGTVLVLDETALSAGALNERGVRNVRALADLATTQELEMDFEFHSARVPTDVSAIAVSASRTRGIVEGLDASLVLRMTAEPRVLSDPAEEGAPDAASLAEMRAFVARARSSSHSIGADAGAEIERAMVAARASDPNATQETFHRWLTMSRLAALARGETGLSIEHWNRARECERLAAERARVC